MSAMDYLTYFSSLPAFAYLSLAAVTSCLILYYLIYWRRTAQWRKSNIPFLPPNFLIGHKYFWSMIRKPWLVPIDRIYKENKDKDVVGFFMATKPMVLVRNPAIIKQIFIKNFDKGIPLSQNDDIAPHMIATSTDEALWKSGRKTLSPMYSLSRFSGDRFAKLRDQIDNMLVRTEQDRLQGKPLDMIQITMNFLFDGVSKSFYGLDANSHEKTGELLRMLQANTRPNFIDVLKSLAKLNYRGIEAFRSQTVISKDMIETMRNLIQKQVAKREQTKTEENDFIDLLIRLKGQNDEKTSNEMDITNQLVGYGFSILFGACGVITECGAVLGAAASQNEYLPGSAMHLLSLYPEHQERIRQEVEETLKKHNTTEFTYEVVQDLHYLNQCLHETARLYPTSTIMMRACAEDFKVPGTDYTFRKGERVIVDPYSIHHDPKYFANPDEFNPDRFSPENKKAIAPETFLAFGNGPRKCPGKNIALLMMSALVGSLVYKYEIQPRSHLKQVHISDFHPRALGIRPKKEFLFDIVPRDVTVC